MMTFSFWSGMNNNVTILNSIFETLQQNTTLLSETNNHGKTHGT